MRQIWQGDAGISWLEASPSGELLIVVDENNRASQFVLNDGRISPDIETVLYRFSQETLTNVLKHAGAETFRLSIIKSYPMIIFSAEDDGFGFDDQIIGKDKQSLGLLGMRERASLLGGTFNLRSTPKFGTRIRIEIPFADESSHETIH